MEESCVQPTSHDRERLHVSSIYLSIYLLRYVVIEIMGLLETKVEIYEKG